MRGTPSERETESVAAAADTSARLRRFAPASLLGNAQGRLRSSIAVRGTGSASSCRSLAALRHLDVDVNFRSDAEASCRQADRISTEARGGQREAHVRVGAQDGSIGFVRRRLAPQLMPAADVAPKKRASSAAETKAAPTKPAKPKTLRKVVQPPKRIANIWVLFTRDYFAVRRFGTSAVG